MLKNHVFDDVNVPIRPDIFIRRMLDVVDNIATMNRLEMQLKTNLLHAKKDERPMKMTAPSQSTDDLNVTLKDLSLEVSEFMPRFNMNIQYFMFLICIMYSYRKRKSQLKIGEAKEKQQRKSHRCVNSILNKQVREN